MSHINFVIPQSKAELLVDSEDQYYVRNVVGLKEMITCLKTAKACYKDEGYEYILENFDVYYSILHHEKKLQMDVIFTAYEHLHRAAQDLSKSINALFDDKDNWSDEFKTKYLNILKMLMYVYINVVNLIEQLNETHNRETLSLKTKGRKKNANDDVFSCDHAAVLLAINYIMQQDISLLWDPPIVEDVFINMISEVCYRCLESASKRTNKEARNEVWSLLGLLVKNYNHGMTFVVRLVQLIKIHEHLAGCVAEGIQHLVETYNCKSLMSDLVQEITEWQTDEAFTDSQGSRNCMKALTDMAAAMPALMLPEVVYLNRYLSYDSYSLRNGILAVITEVILTVLTKKDLSEEDRETRDELLSILEEHISDISSFVRSKVFQHWCRLQKENAVPIKMQTKILEKAVFHLRDKAAAVRKCSVNCITTFLEHNLYASSLQLSKMRSELEEQSSALKFLKAELEGFKVDKLKEIEEEWIKHQDDIRATIEETLELSTQEDPDLDIEKESIPELIRKNIREKNYDKAFTLCRLAARNFEEFKTMRDNIEAEQEVDLFLMLMRTIHSNISSHTIDEVRTEGGKGPTEDDLTRLVSLERTVDYLSDAVKFLELIDAAMKPMKDLLDSASSGDMQEAVDFYVAAYKFNIDNSVNGVLEILRVMQRSDADRRQVILNAFKTIYLVTEAKSMTEHTSIIVERLIDFLFTVPFDNHADMTLIISEWVAKGILDNSVIDTLWQYFTKKIEVSDEKSRAALTLLTMAAQGRRTIVLRNIKLIHTVAFGERGLNNILLVTQACRMLSIAGREKQDITDKNPPFKIQSNDTIWKDLCDILVTIFDKKVKFVNGLITAAIDFIYRVCAKPIMICDQLLTTLVNKVFEGGNHVDPMGYIICRCNLLLGVIALKHLNFLDEVVYKELKRRNYIREERKNNKIGKKKADKNKNSNSSVCQRVNNSILQNSMAIDNLEESTLEGAQAEDADAEYISRILESRTVTENTGLGNLANHIVHVCERPDVYDEENIQCSSITALLRYMLVSNQFCSKYIQLIFTILEKTKFEEVKVIILIHCSDLLEKCPNIIEPYTPRLYSKLVDPNIKVRKATLFMLSNLILRDMLRAQGNISEMAKCIVDEDEEMRDMAKNFFVQLSHKANNLYNLLPDIFIHLTKSSDDEKLRTIMKFLFGLIDKNKQMENLVERFSSKFRFAEDDNVASNIAYCLSLVQYNEKGLKNLIDNFPSYKHQVLVNDVYLLFKQIIGVCSKKKELKPLATKLEEKIKNMFEITDGASVPSVKGTPAFKKPRGVTKKRPNAPKHLSLTNDESDDSPSDQEKENNFTPSRNAKKSRKAARARRQKRLKPSSDSD